MEQVLLDRLKSALAGRYTFERELGRGGTAVVYLAHDRKHDRRVAFKVLLPEIAIAIGAERFQREISIAARLTHPHILALFDSGEAGGLLYYVMPFVEGESLRDYLLRSPRLPVSEAIRIGTEVASALERAHRDGVIHRDIKPENILLEGGYAIVADFGIARARSEAEAGTITQTGMVVGTPMYMSPEQSLGASDVDGRTDLYSLACVIFEMLAGVPPFPGTTFKELVMRHTMDSAPSVTVARPETPSHVAVALARALAKDPADRFDSATEFSLALTTPSADSAGREGLWGRLRAAFMAKSPEKAPMASQFTSGRASSMATAGTTPGTAPGTAPGTVPGGLPRVATVTPSTTGVPAGHYATPFTTTPSGRQPIDSLAVLPFVCVGNDPEGEYVSEGITESIMNKLAGLSGLRVVPRSVVFRYKGKDLDPCAIAHEVHARAVVSGRILRREDTIIVKAELVDAVTEAQLWGEQYNRTISDIFAVQEEMAAEITRSLRLKLTGEEEKGLAKRFTENPEAYRAYLRGRHHWNKRTVVGLRAALSHFQQAIDLDPNYALAYTGLADTFNILGYYNNQRPHDAYPKGKAAAKRALEIDDTLAEAHASMGYVTLFYDLDFAGAEACFQRTIALNPKYATGHHWRAWYLFVVERFDEALDELRHAQSLDPLSLIINDHLGYALLLAGKPDEALEQLKKTRELDPTFPWTYWRLGRVYMAMGRYEEAIGALANVVEITEGGVALGDLGYAYAAAGRMDEARAVISRLDALAAGSFVSPLEYAFVHAGLGEVEAALVALESAYEERVSDFARVKILPWPDAIRETDRFRALVSRIAAQT